MKLAEALQERSDLNRRIEQLRERLQNNAIVQEGEKPAEDPQALIRELDGCIARLEELIGRINLTNSQTRADGSTLTEQLARRDALTMKLSAYRELVGAASQIGRRSTRGEVKYFRTVDVQALQKQVDQLSRELRLLDNRIQETNWTTQLLES